MYPFIDRSRNPQYCCHISLYEMNVTHIKPSGVGAEIVASAVLTEVEGRKLTFNVGARDAEGMIGEGVHVRYVVDREKFMSKVR